MHLLIDALSVNNLSGRHVLLGHVDQLSAQLAAHHRLSLVTHRDNVEVAASLPARVKHLVAPTSARWLPRGWWGLLHADQFARAQGVDAVFSPSGMLGPGWGVPQVVLAQNPWPLLPGLAHGRERLKSWLQRRAFARAQRWAARMVYNSGYMRDLYAANFGATSMPAVVAYQGIDEALLAGRQDSDPEVVNRRRSILCVSVMARHKAIEVLVEAYAMLLPNCPGAELVLVGSWPDPGYRAEIEAQVAALPAGAYVRMAGHVSNEELHELYGRARVFSLLSRCESFGIPAVEAQAFGTPTVVADGTAQAEVAGPGGRVVPQDDAVAASDALASILLDDALATDLSSRALVNCRRFCWTEVSQPLIAAIETLATTLDGA